MKLKIPQSSITIGEDEPVFIVAEIGKNFIQTQEEQPLKTYLENAKRLVTEAQKSGASAVKFQTHNYEDEQLKVDIISPHFKGVDRYQWVKRNTLPTDFWSELKKYCDQQGILFFSTPMSRGAAEILEEIDIPLWKVGSGDILDFVALDFMKKTNKPIIISSGMSTLEEIDRALEFLKETPVALLHCVSRYPCPAEQLNLQTISFFKERYKVPIGFSDHSLEIETVTAAVALNAVIIEKHFSLNRNLWGADHKTSLIPNEFKLMAEKVRAVQNNKNLREQILNSPLVKAKLGNKEKFLQAEETVFRPIFRKALMAGQDIPAGTNLTASMVYAMRPQIYAGGLASENFNSIIGKKVKRNLKKYEPIQPEVLG